MKLMRNDMEGLYDSINNNSNERSNLSSTEIYSDTEASNRQHVTTKLNQQLLKAPRLNPSDRLNNHDVSRFGFNSKENEY